LIRAGLGYGKLGRALFTKKSINGVAKS